MPRNTSRAIVVHNGKILLMERWRDGKHYFSIPGGGIEAGESLEAAAAREIEEETSLKVTVLRQLYEFQNGKNYHYFFLCEYQSGEPHLPPGSEEAQAGPRNRFKPLWIPTGELADLPFVGYFLPVRNLLLDDLQNGFSESVKITAA